MVAERGKVKTGKIGVVVADDDNLVETRFRIFTESISASGKTQQQPMTLNSRQRWYLKNKVQHNKMCTENRRKRRLVVSIYAFRPCFFKKKWRSMMSTNKVKIVTQKNALSHFHIRLKIKNLPSTLQPHIKKNGMVDLFLEILRNKIILVKSSKT